MIILLKWRFFWRFIFFYWWNRFGCRRLLNITERMSRNLLFWRMRFLEGFFPAWHSFALLTSNMVSRRITIGNIWPPEFVCRRWLWVTLPTVLQLIIMYLSDRTFTSLTTPPYFQILSVSDLIKCAVSAGRLHLVMRIISYNGMDKFDLK